MTDPTVPSRSPFWTSLPRPVLVVIACVYCVATAIYSVTWMYDATHPNFHPVELGFNASQNTYYDPVTSSIPVFNVTPGSPAEAAGLRTGDRIIGLNGHAVASFALFEKLWGRARPGDGVELTVRRTEAPEPVTLHATFRAAMLDRGGEGVARSSAREIISFYPIFFVLVGFPVLFFRVDDTHAWLLALLFAGFIAVPSFNNQSGMPDLLRDFTAFYQLVFASLISSFFYIFFALFPAESPLERRAPWLKWAALALGLSHLLPGLPFGHPSWPVFLARLIGDRAALLLRYSLNYLFTTLGLLSLLWNCYSSETAPKARRKSRVILAGTLVGVLPIIVERILVDFSGYRPNFWLDMTLVLLVLLYPLSFAYAIIKHRVLEIPVLLRRSVRYLLVQRGFFFLLFCGALLAIVLFSRFFAGYFAGNSPYGMTLSAAFGVALVWFSGPLVKRGTDQIDRAFFRSAYDARRILQDLAEKTRRVTDRQELATLLELEIKGALHPQSLAIYLDVGDADLVAQTCTAAADPRALDTILPRPRFPFRFGAVFVLRDAEKLPPAMPLLAEVTRYGRAWDVPPPVSDAGAGIPALTPECLVPILGPNSGLIGLIVLGPRLSEEPYSSEDKRLLDSVAGQAAIALENMRLAEQIANRLESDRRVAQEMKIAREVQGRLFPQVLPPLSTLEYTGACIQARQVGGDYFDFLDLGSSHLAFVLADISGKGIAGALMMANLQANLRSRPFREILPSQYTLALENVPQLLRSVNQFFYENTPDDCYATLFFAVYDDRTREFEYANCGHNPPLVFHADGSFDRLESTSTVIGLFQEWKCVTRTISLKPGDVLVIYTDGVTEAQDGGRNEFGEERVVETLRAHLQDSPAQLLSRIQQAVQSFTVGEQSDDLTVVVARAR